MTAESPEFWKDCPLIWSDPETKHGVPVFKGTRLEPETVIGSVDAYIQLEGLSEEEAIEATYKDHPTAPGKDAIRQVLSFGWNGTRNGKLLAAIEAAGFNVMITNDKNLSAQQNC